MIPNSMIDINGLQVRIPTNSPLRTWLIRAKYNPVRNRFRLQTGYRRTLPSSLIIGAPKCGTTSLFYYLAQHPLIKSSFVKEVRFFNRHYAKGVDWYRSFFQLSGRTQPASSISIEGTPTYLYLPEAATRVQETLPNVKLIVMLRDPIERAYSYYNHMVRNGRETRSFDAAVAYEIENLLEQPLDSVNEVVATHARAIKTPYVRGGYYAQHLEHWLSLFERDQFIFIFSQDFYSDTERVLQGVYQFLGVPLIPSQEKKRKKYHNFGYEPMREDVRQFLTEHYTGPNRQLSKLLEVELGWQS